jgi:Tfp pilus assembly protein PilX
MKTPVHGQSKHRERGVVLVFAMIALVIMLIGAVAIIRSMNSAQFNIGNIGFKRDLSNQSERAVQAAMDAVRGSGVLADPTVRLTNLKSANYSAVKLTNNAQGIPTALLSDTEFATVGTATNDIVVSDLNVTLRYVVDRLATTTGSCSTDTCIVANQTVFGGSSSEWINSQTNSGAPSNPNPSAVPQQPIYRLTVRLTGPRNTLSFFQSTFTSD